MQKTFLSRVSEALDKILESLKISREILRMANDFAYEMKAMIANGIDKTGHKIKRFISRKVKSAFALLGKNSMISNLVLGQQPNSSKKIASISSNPDTALSKDFALGNAFVSVEVLRQLKADEQLFEQAFYERSKAEVPDLLGDAQEVFKQQLGFVSDEIESDLGLRALFDENNGVVFAHNAGKVEALQNGLTSPASERILTFTYNADPFSRDTMEVTSLRPDRTQIGGPASIPVRNDYT